MIKAIVFDMDDTLYDQRTPFASALQTVTNEPITPADTLDELFDSFQFSTSQTTDDREIPDLGNLLNPILTGHGLPIISSSNWDKFWELYQDRLTRISLFDEIKSYLSSLKDVYELGIITDGSVEQQSKKAGQLDLGRWFKRDNVVISDSVGLAKPDARIFTYFNRKLNLQANEVVYIGDDYTTDMVGAKQAGWHAFWFNHRHLDTPTADYIPDQTVESAAELADLLKALTVTAY